MVVKIRGDLRGRVREDIDLRDRGVVKIKGATAKPKLKCPLVSTDHDSGKALGAFAAKAKGFTGIPLGLLNSSKATKGKIKWKYKLDDDDPRVAALGAGEKIKETYKLKVMVAGSKAVSKKVKVVITGENDAPVIQSAVAGGNFSENAAPQAVNLLPKGAITDVDASDVLSVVAGTLTQTGGRALTSATLNGKNLEFDPNEFNDLTGGQNENLIFTYDVSDGHGGTVTQTVRLTITGADEAPTITSNGGGDTALINVDENTTAVTTVTASDLDSPVLTFSIIGGADQLLFQIDENTGELSFVAAPDSENPGDSDSDNSYEVEVEASDGSLIDTQTITVAVQDVNEFQPIIVSNGGGPSAGINVLEETTAVTTVMATDQDANPIITYSISGGADALLFQIDAGAGSLSFITPPDFDAPADSDSDNVYEVTVQASDGAFGATQDLSVTVLNLIDAPVIISNGGGDTAVVNISENLSYATTVVAADLEPGVTYSISGGIDAALFLIDLNTGDLTFITAPDFENPSDADQNNSYDVEVRATDIDTLFDTQLITVNVGDAGVGGTLSLSFAEGAQPNEVTVEAFFDSGGAKLEIDWGDGAFSTSPYQEFDNNINDQHAYAPNFIGMASVKALDDTTEIASLDFNVKTAPVGTGVPLTGESGVRNVLIGNTGNDTLTGGMDDDVLSGDAGIDNLTGAGGDDILSGGGGGDVFHFAVGFGRDKITDFTPGSDVIEFSTTVFANAAAVLAATTDDDQGDAVITWDAANKITLTGITKSMLSSGDFDFV